MSYHWNWGILLSPVSTGEPTTYLGWLMSGFWVTITVSLSAWVIALIVGPIGWRVPPLERGRAPAG